MIDVNELRKGVTFETDGNIYRVIEYEHHKPGRGKATIKVKTKNLKTGSTLDMSFISGDRVQDIDLDHQKVQYLYSDGDLYYFMDMDTYEQPSVSADVLGDAAKYLIENMEVKLTFYNHVPLDVEIPLTVEHKVVEAEPSVRGDTATGINKKVITETGLEVTVPGFINTGDTIRIDTRSGSYVSRV